MKAKDIEVGNEYAIELFSNYFVRGYVVAVGDVTRRVYGARSFHGHLSTSKMVSYVRMRSDAPRGHLNGNVETCVLAKVKRTWSEHVVRDQAEQEHKSSVDASYKSLENELEQLTGVRVYITRPGSEWGRHTPGYTSISASDIRKIVAALKKEEVA